MIGSGAKFSSFNPATTEILWTGTSATEKEINNAVLSARRAFPIWSGLSFDERLHYLNQFHDELQQNRDELKEIISKETGKPLWEADTEVGAMISKIPISVEAYHARCKETIRETGNGLSVTVHKPHGVVAVFGPFNFPGHLPNGHIIPALLAGNTVIFKSSELTPWVSEKILSYWHKVKIPPGVINLVQGGPVTGSLLSEHKDLDGLMFTGSAKTGNVLLKLHAERPEKIIALEMGGNNPLIVHEVKNIKAAVYNTLQSAYITAGQRCTCARRLIVTKGPLGEKFVQELILAIKKCVVGPYTDSPEPFMGPLISSEAAMRVMESYDNLIKMGAKILVPLALTNSLTNTFLSPALLDVTNVQNRPDEEIFGPLLQLIWVDNFEMAIEEANHTAYGLSAGLFCEDELLYKKFLQNIQAGVINWNRPLTGASSSAPFGGIGKSGNHRPSGYYAADYCAYPVASLEQRQLVMPNQLTPGISV